MLKTIAVAATFSAVAGAGFVGHGELTARTQTLTRTQNVVATKTVRHGHLDSFTGTRKIRVNGYSVNVSCSGRTAARKPVVMLMAGAGDGLDTMAGLQRTLSKEDRVCSYDRLGEGRSDQPKGPQTIRDSGEILTGVLDRIAGDRPVVLAAHSLGGLIAGRYAPDHQDRVKGLVLMDATIPALKASILKVIPETATGIAAEVRAQVISINEGQNPEQIVIPDAEVRSAGDIPVQIIKHEAQFGGIPDYGPALEQAWSEGQQQWRALSRRSVLSTAAGSGHYIHVDRPDLAVKAIQTVTDQAAAARW
ncbi:alpha/beta fold hydrolase [Streptomyces sp. NPDC086519]|uniref:alpha/beta fold hydrolase n=1 Tax=Streptomyces sp. NPDC086519 TaxID=3154863 RepID=UPI0034366D15